MIARTTTAILLLAGLGAAQAQDATEAPGAPLANAISETEARLEASLQELTELRDRLAEEKIPLAEKLSDLESELSEVREEYQRKARMLDTRALDLGNIQTDSDLREGQASYIANLLGDYGRNFDSRLHIAERQRYEDALMAALLAPDNSNLSEEDVFATQLALLDTSFERAFDALGGTRFEGKAVVDAGRIVSDGTFVLVGPSAIFLSGDGTQVGTAELRLGSLEPTVVAFTNPEDAIAAKAVVEQGSGRIPFDSTLGNAHKIEATESETLWEEIQKGGAVMVPIFVMAGAALLVALLKWIGLTFTRKPSQKKIDALLTAVGEGDEATVRERARAIRGPVGKMLAAGVQHMREPRDLIEETMFETVLLTRLKTQRFLPFIAVCAASAPLLGLLGTVTGIISTFRMIEVFGSGDVKSLSGGISEALVTTKYGLIVAIPSLLIHAFLSRKARAVVDQMEKAGVAFVNQVERTTLTPIRAARRPDAQPGSDSPDPELVREQVQVILRDLFDPLVQSGAEDDLATSSTNG